MKPDWEKIFTLLTRQVEKSALPSVSQIARKKKDPFRVLISTMISLRTKDEVTLAASHRLFSLADTPRGITELEDDQIAKAIYPAGFYKTKTKHIKDASALLLKDFGGTVPPRLEDLLGLPGVGRKTANLVLNLGFGIEAICVDTHVHRISNRFGWIESDSPEKTELMLMEILPKKYWIDINELLVSFGQKVCSPQSPFCTQCLLNNLCLKKGVTRSR